jgi:predicted TIM-barrel fold metal-dependent hydrolase
MYDGKVIDFHIHVGHKDIWQPWVQKFLSASNPELMPNHDELMSCEGLDRYLEGEGIEYAVVLAENAPVTTGVISNEFVEGVCGEGKRFLPFASVDPNRDENPAALLEEWVAKKGFRGLKLYPSYQHFYPNEPKVYPLYEKALELGIPVMFHTGISKFRGSKVKYSDPIHLDDVAVDFPDLPLVMAHSGRDMWYDRAFSLARLHDNVYLELSGLPPKRLLTYFPRLESVADRVIFGSDWPSVTHIRDNVEAIRALPMSDEAQGKILYENARRVLRL